MLISAALVIAFNWQLLIVEEPVVPSPQDLERAVELLFPSPHMRDCV